MLIPREKPEWLWHWSDVLACLGIAAVMASAMMAYVGFAS